MRFIGNIIEKLQRLPKRGGFRDGDEPRILQAARQFQALRLGAPILLGDVEKIQATAKYLNIPLEGIRIINPATSEDLENFSKRFHSLRREKGLRPTEAREAMLQPNFYGAMMLAMHQADGLVSGASHITGSVLRPLFQIIKGGAGHPHGFQLHGHGSGEHAHWRGGGIVHGGLRRDSGAERGTACGHRHLHGAAGAASFGECVRGWRCCPFPPREARPMPRWEKSRRRPRMARRKASQLFLEADFDGEMQVDAALVPETAVRKLHDSQVAGRANVLIFPTSIPATSPANWWVWWAGPVRTARSCWA